jgi:hypothetical protein
MIWHEAPGKNITYGIYELSDLFYKEQIITLGIEYGFIGSVINMVNMIFIEMHKGLLNLVKQIYEISSHNF